MFEKYSKENKYIEMKKKKSARVYQYVQRSVKKITLTQTDRLRFLDFSRFSQNFSKNNLLSSFSRLCMNPVRDQRIARATIPISTYSKERRKSRNLLEELFSHNYFSAAQNSTKSYSQSKESKQTNFSGISKVNPLPNLLLLTSS